ncbi:hypothetical protein SAMN00017405_1544 [Desulfonispora thiosulfatigenes DSM 11270]|uniref:Asp23 family, cell envelope-related function n=1 Tax=Desulfonispora thiosulfatigenes DSM 11270 TaxID=656914 RepID=A0A1W1VT56_DESTI|nr:hypothetical protein [Desulfonispora thiosulfatigenes]SMB96453.1 hypothetical protein SAMN00017405_1544 [Desulfonispora thiosulfatigenes DSM 11270]
MEIFALVGSSGTGKSHKANYLANQRKIDTIIDDGLLIKDGKKLAGISAKRELTIVQAVKRAIFLDENHALDVKEKITEVKPDRILILGTSDRMVKKIATALELPDITEIIKIEDISSAKDIQTAKKMRFEYGKHVIPVPTIEIKKDFPNYFMDSFKSFFVRKGQKKEVERTIIRPRFSMLGKLVISEHVIEEFLKVASSKIELIESIIKSKITFSDEGVKIYSEVKVYYGSNIITGIQKFQQEVINIVENLAGLNVLGIDVHVKMIEPKDN